MALFRIVPRGDVEIADSLPSLLVGVPSRKQKIAQRLKFSLGEWFLDQRLGVPYRRDVFRKNPDPTIIRRLFMKVLLSVDGVTSVPRLLLGFDFPARTLSVAFEAVFADGERVEVLPGDRLFLISF